MINKIISPILIIIIIVSISCKQNKVGKEEFKRITIELDKTILDDTISKYLKIDKFVQLETSPEVIIGGVTKILSVDNHIFIFNSYRNQYLYMFTEEGVFLRNLIKIGKGPGEGADFSGFYVDTVQKQVHLIDSSSKVIKVDDEGNLISEYECPPGSSHLVKLDNSTIVFSSEYEFQIYQTDLTGNILGKFILFDRSFQRGLITPLIETAYGVLYNRFMDDTLYFVNKDVVKPGFLIDFQDKRITREKYLGFPEEMGRRQVGDSFMYRVRIMGNTDKQISIYFSHNQKTYFTFIDLETSQNRVFDLSQVSEDSNLGKGFYNRSSYSKNHFIGYFNPGSLEIENIPLLDTIESINPNDNPILVYYRFDFER